MKVHSTRSLVRCTGYCQSQVVCPQQINYFLTRNQLPTNEYFYPHVNIGCFKQIQYIFIVIDRIISHLHSALPDNNQLLQNSEFSAI